MGPDAHINVYMNLVTKYCPKCRTEKPEKDFCFSRRNPDGRFYLCRKCQRENAVRWERENPDKKRARGRRYREAHLHLLQAKDRQYYQRTRAQRLLVGKVWQKKNPEKVAAAKRNWAKRNPEKVRESLRKNHIQQEATVVGSLNKLMRHGLFLSLRGGKAGRPWESLVGYSARELVVHLESLFEQGMTWELLRRGDIQIDHIFPLSRLVFDNAEDPTFQYAWSLGNLQPLWREDNQRKGTQVPWEFKLARAT